MENDTLAFLQQRIKFVPKKTNPPCIASLMLIKHFWAALKKAVDNKGCESPSFPSLKGKICQKAHNVSLSMVLLLFNTIKERLTICAQDEHWDVYCLALICLQRMTKSICTVFFSLSTTEYN